MNPARLQTFITAYVQGLTKAVTEHPHRYRTKPGDTPEVYALRVACTVTELLQRRGPSAVDLDAEGFRNACRELGIEHSERVIYNFLEVA